MRRDNQDAMGEKRVKNAAGQLSLDEEAKKLGKSIMSVFSTLSSLGTQWNSQRNAQSNAQVGQSQFGDDHKGHQQDGFWQSSRTVRC